MKLYIYLILIIFQSCAIDVNDINETETLEIAFGGKWKVNQKEKSGCLHVTAINSLRISNNQDSLNYYAHLIDSIIRPKNIEGTCMELEVINKIGLKTTSSTWLFE